MSGIWLGIETTAELGGAALTGPDGILAETMLPVRAYHSEKLLPAIAAMLSEAGTGKGELAGIGVSIGPGSYTGLRIGTATALGLSAGWGVPLKGVSTLRVLASQLPAGPVLACIRARKGEVFAGVFDTQDPLSDELIPQGLYRADDLAGMVTGMKLNAAGSGRTELPVSVDLNWVLPLQDRPRPSSAAFCASVLAGAKGFDNELEPLYLRGFNEKA